MAEGEEMCHTYLALLLLPPSAAIVSAAEEEAMGRHNPTPGIEMCVPPISSLSAVGKVRRVL